MTRDEYSPKAYSTIQETQLKYWEKIRHPFVAGLELTPACNLRCVHCYLHDYGVHDMLPASDWKKIIDRLYDAGVLILYMTGGEILTRKDFAEIYIYAKERGFIIELLTNATALDDAAVEVFKKYPPATVSVSVYGMRAETYEAVTGVKGSFERCMRAVRRLHEADIDTEIKFIGLRENKGDLYEAQAFAASIGAKFKFNFEIFPAFEGETDVIAHRLPNEEILEIEKADEAIHGVLAANVLRPNPFADSETVPLFTCNVASTLCYIDSLGYVSPCNKMRLRDHNILREPLGEIWKDYIARYAYMPAPKEYPCAKCKYVFTCSPCPVINKLATGSYHIPCRESCELAKMRVAEFSKAKYDKFRGGPRP